MHFVSEFLPCAKSLSILKCRLSDIGKRLLCKKSLVGSERNVREREQSLHGRGFEDMLGHIFIDKIRLFFINIEPYSEKFVIPDTCDQVFGADQAAAGGVYENSMPSTSALISVSPPLAQLIRMTPSFIRERLSLLIIW